MNTSAPVEPAARAAAGPRGGAAPSTAPCPVCSARGEPLYDDLEDRLFGAAGQHRMLRCAAPACATLWLSPPPTPDELAAAYARYYTHDDEAPPSPSRSLAARSFHALASGYLAQRFGYRAGVRWWQRACGRLLRLLPVRRAGADFSVCHLPSAGPGARLLEVGCGGGAMLARMAALGWQAEGLDFDPAAVRAARSRGLEVRQGELAAARFPEGTFDAVALLHVIEHVVDPEALLAECRRVARPGGRVVLVTPNAGCRAHRRFGRHWRGLEPPRHLQLFTRASLVALCERVGMHVELATTSVRDADNMYRQSRALEEGRPDAYGARSNRAWSRVQQLRDWCASWFDRDAGQELVVVATVPRR